MSSRLSDRSFSSVRTTFSDLKPPCDVAAHLPSLSLKPEPHASTSTISRDSHASSESPPPPRSSHASQIKPLPKAPVFLHNRPFSSSLTPFSNPTKPSTARNPRDRQIPQPSPTEKRCVSDMQAIQLNRPPFYFDPLPEPQSLRTTARRDAFTARHHTDMHDAMRYLTEDDDFTHWIPDDELQNWTTVTPNNKSPSHQPSTATNKTAAQKWATSWRSLTNFYRPRREPPCLRGSFLEVQPPTLTERFGLAALSTDRSSRTSAHKPRSSEATKLAFSRRKRRNFTTNLEELAPIARGDPKPDPSTSSRHFPPNDSTHVDANAPNLLDVRNKDEYVGFLVEPISRKRTSRTKWFNFLRRRKP